MRRYAEILVAVLALWGVVELGFLFHSGLVHNNISAKKAGALNILVVGDSTSYNYPPFLLEKLKSAGVNASIDTIIFPLMADQAISLAKFLQTKSPDLAITMLTQASEVFKAEPIPHWEPALISLVKNRIKDWNEFAIFLRDRFFRATLSQVQGSRCATNEQMGFVESFQEEMVSGNNGADELSDAAGKLNHIYLRCAGDSRLYPAMAILRELEGNALAGEYFLRQAKSVLGDSNPQYQLANTYFQIVSLSAVEALAFLIKNQNTLLSFSSARVMMYRMYLRQSAGGPQAMPGPGVWGQLDEAIQLLTNKTDATKEELTRKDIALNRFLDVGSIMRAPESAAEIYENLLKKYPKSKLYSDLRAFALQLIPNEPRAFAAAEEAAKINPGSFQNLKMVFELYVTSYLLENSKVPLARAKNFFEAQLRYGQQERAINCFLSMLQYLQEKNLAILEAIPQKERIFPRLNPFITKLFPVKVSATVATLDPELDPYAVNSMLCREYKKILELLNRRKVPWVGMQSPNLPYETIKTCLGAVYESELFDSRNSLRKHGQLNTMLEPDFLHLNNEGGKNLGNELGEWLILNRL